MTAPASNRITVRRATESDAAACLAYARFIFTTTDQLLRVPNELELTVEQEAEWLRDAASKNNLILVATCGNDVVGLLSCDVKSFVKMKHVAEFGVSVHPNHQRAGIGTRLIETTLAWVKDETTIEKLILNVFDTNPGAINLYRRFGFVEECRQAKAAKQPDGSYVDMIQMRLFVNR